MGCAKIGLDILKACDNNPKQGIEQRVILINREDIAANGLVYDTTFKNELITKINLKAAKPALKGVLIEGAKTDMDFAITLEVPDTGGNGFKHSITGLKIYDPSAAAIAEINKLISGVNVIAVIEAKWSGVDKKSAFRVLGVTYGLEVTADSKQSGKEQQGTFVLNLATPAGLLEPYAPPIFLNTDYATSLTNFDNKFIGALAP